MLFRLGYLKAYLGYVSICDIYDAMCEFTIR
jgi:hypothetical protein